MRWIAHADFCTCARCSHAHTCLTLHISPLSWDKLHCPTPHPSLKTSHFTPLLRQAAVPHSSPLSWDKLQYATLHPSLETSCSAPPCNTVGAPQALARLVPALLAAHASTSHAESCPDTAMASLSVTSSPQQGGFLTLPQRRDGASPQHFIGHTEPQHSSYTLYPPSHPGTLSDEQLVTQKVQKELQPQDQHGLQEQQKHEEQKQSVGPVPFLAAAGSEVLLLTILSQVMFMHRVGQNHTHTPTHTHTHTRNTHIYGVYTVFLQGIHQIYGHMRRIYIYIYIYMVLANPYHVRNNSEACHARNNSEACHVRKNSEACHVPQPQRRYFQLLVSFPCCNS